jgi:hypothetical protein
VVALYDFMETWKRERYRERWDGMGEDKFEWPLDGEVSNVWWVHYVDRMRPPKHSKGLPAFECSNQSITARNTTFRSSDVIEIPT